MKILAVFPEIVTRGGCERSLLALAENFDMDVLTNRFTPEKTYEGWKNVRGKVIVLNKPNKFLFGLELAMKKFSGYDLFYSHGYFITNFINIQNMPAVWYCHTPKRDLYNPTMEFYLKNMGRLREISFLASLPAVRAIDKFLAKRMTRVVANSQNVKNRIKDSYNIGSEVIYSACIEKISKTPSGDFYFFPGRITTTKRIEIAVNAFRKMPDKKLIVAGSSVDKIYLKFLEKNKPKNVRIITDVTEDRMSELYKTCIAAICMAENEDFGFTPVESMSFGKPCIAAREGGLMESVVDGKTGLLISPDETSLIQAIEKFENRFGGMSSSCVERARMFRKENYIKNMKRVFESAI